MGYIYQNGHIVIYKILTAEGFQKGLKTILLERGLWRDGIKKEDALGLLLQQDDFDPTKLSSILDETVINITRNSILLRCIGDIPRGRLEPSVTMSGDPCWYECQKLWIQCYWIGLNDGQVESAIKKYISHRSIPPAYMEDNELWELS